MTTLLTFPARKSFVRHISHNCELRFICVEVKIDHYALVKSDQIASLKIAVPSPSGEQYLLPNQEEMHDNNPISNYVCLTE